MTTKTKDVAVVEAPANAKDVTPFTATDKKALAKAEAAIEAGVRSFMDVGKALLAIRDGRLYRQTHDTFEAYVQQRWAMERVTAYDYLAAPTVAENVGPAQLRSLSHVHLLAPLDADKQREVAPVIAEMNRAQARSYVQNLDKVEPAAVRRVQALFKDEPAPENGLAAFRDAAVELNLQVLTLDELTEFAGIIKSLAAAYGDERVRRNG